MTSPVVITTITSDEEFDALQDCWQTLEERSASASIFVTWDWQRLWWRHYGCARSLRILVAREAGTVVGILPLYVQRVRSLGVFPVRLLRSLGTGGDTSPDYLDPLMDPEAVDRVSAELASFVVMQLSGWDVLKLSDLDPQSRFMGALEERCRQAGYEVNIGESARIPFARLPDSWDGYLASLSRSRRQALRYSRRKFEKLDGARFRLCQDPAELDDVFRRLAELHRLRWRDRAAHHSFSSREYLSFHGALIHAVNARGRLRLYVLETAETTVAVLYCFRFHDDLFYFQSGLNPGFSAFSPGQVLIAYTIESAIADGCRSFDMLKGDYGHKRHFVKETRVTAEVTAYRAGMPVWGYRLTKLAARLFVRTKVSN